MKKFYNNTSYIFRLDKNIQEGKPAKRKIKNIGNGSYSVAIPPKIVSDINSSFNSNEVELTIRTGKELMYELMEKGCLEDQFIIIKPINKKENVS